MNKIYLTLGIAFFSFETTNAATISVTSTADNGVGSLRAAVAAAVAGDEIVLNTSDTIKLSSEITIDKSLSITKTSKSEKVISGNGLTRIFTVNSGVTLTASDITFARANTIGNGGAILSDGILAISGCNFAKNRAEIKGGAISIQSGSATVTNCYFELNNCYNNTNYNTHIPYGGAVHIGSNTTGTIDRCTFYQNYCRSASWTVGGAIGIEGTGTVKNSTLAYNTLESTNSNYQSIGAGIGIVSNTGIANIYSNTIVNNNVINGANSGAGIGTWQMGLHDINSNIIYGNTYKTTTPMDIKVGQSGNKGSGGYNLIGTYGGNFVTAPTDILNTNPALGTYAANGGVTKNYPIECTSPAYGKGKALHASTVAQNGVTRGTRVDIGSYSWNGTLPSANISTTNPSCSGNTNGSAMVSNITSGYSYKWTGNVSGNSVSNLAAGNYKLYISDDNGCSDSISFTLTNPSVLAVSGTITNDGGSSNGAIDVSTTGGTAPYTYLWTPGSSTTEDLTQIAAGTYNINVTDSKGCTTSNQFSVNLVTSVENANAKEMVIIYPNPTSGIVYINSENPISNTLVLNSKGDVVYSFQGNSYDLSTLNSGAYFLQINWQNGLVSHHQIVIK